MKKPFAAYYLLLLVLILVTTWLRSQDMPPGIPLERLQVRTDRTMYISGEKILFSAFLYNENATHAVECSRIMYCELITPDGNQINKGKYLLENFMGQGCLQIPDETITGIYYFRCYTRFMRNLGPDGYQYIMLKIINPYKAEVLTGDEVEDTIYSTGKETVERHPDWRLSISPDKKRYYPRENIALKIAGNTLKEIPVKLCLTVIPEMAFEGNLLTKRTTVPSYHELHFYPETRGISLCGKVLESETGQPIPNALVNLSIIGDEDAMAIRTDSSGRYFFALPDYTSSRDIFLCSENYQGNSPEIFIENDFCPQPVNLPSPAFHLSEEEAETAYKLAINQKISSIFLKDTLPGEPEPSQNAKPFYGEPTQILVMEKYIDLPTLEEYFNELPFGVDVRKSQGTKHFRFYNTRTEMTIYDPLVLIDWVAVSDIEKVLAMSPAGIGRIELVNSPYVKGNITYGGIISFISKKNDFAGINLPESGTFIVYKFLEDCSRGVPASLLPDNIPDSRNTIYWNPDVQTDVSGSADILFTAPDTPGKYVILLSGMNRKGEAIMIREDLEVVIKN